MSRILVTGAAGFVGSNLCNRLLATGNQVRRMVRPSGSNEGALAGGETVAGDIGSEAPDLAVFVGVDAVVHLAARVHTVRDDASNPLAAFRAMNVECTRALALRAAEAGARRFIFLSSVKVHGEATSGTAFSESDTPQPEDPYGISKFEAEDALREISRETGLNVVILRPPLVYGPGVKANFLRMMRWIDRGLPLPLAAVRNARSLVYVGNLVDAIMLCLDHPAAAGETFLVDDGTPVSTPQLLREIGDALGRPARLFPVPPALLQGAATLVGRGGDAARLLGDLVVDSTRVRRVLSWQPPYTRGEGLAKTVEWFRGLPKT